MKRSRILMTAGTLILAIAAMLATKASKKFGSGFKTASINGAVGNVAFSQVVLTTTASGNVPIYVNLYTNTGTSPVTKISGTLVTSSGAQLFYH